MWIEGHIDGVGKTDAVESIHGNPFGDVGYRLSVKSFGDVGFAVAGPVHTAEVYTFILGVENPSVGGVEGLREGGSEEESERGKDFEKHFEESGVVRRLNERGNWVVAMTSTLWKWDFSYISHNESLHLQCVLSKVSYPYSKISVVLNRGGRIRRINESSSTVEIASKSILERSSSFEGFCEKQTETRDHRSQPSSYTHK